MSASLSSSRFHGLLVALGLGASCSIMFGCQHPNPFHQTEQPRYPAVVFDVPRCYDMDEKGDCHKEGTYLYLDFDYLSKSDSLLWQDIDKLRKRSKYWRLSVFKASDGTLQIAKGWAPTSDVTVQMELPLEKMYSAEFEFCSRPSSKECDDDMSEDKIISREIPFLMHKFPED